MIGAANNQKRTARLNISLCNFQLHYYNSWKLPTAKPPPVSTPPQPQSTGSNNKSNGLFSLLGYFTGSNKKAQSNNLLTDVHQLSTSSSNNLTTTNNASSDYNFTEDLMQLFSVVNVRIQKVIFNF